jgi:hypothetical protein
MLQAEASFLRCATIVCLMQTLLGTRVEGKCVVFKIMGLFACVFFAHVLGDRGAFVHPRGHAFSFHLPLVFPSVVKQFSPR